MTTPKVKVKMRCYADLKADVETAAAAQYRSVAAWCREVFEAAADRCETLGIPVLLACPPARPWSAIRKTPMDAAIDVMVPLDLQDRIARLAGPEGRPVAEWCRVAIAAAAEPHRVGARGEATTR